jgi:hypothetical protein
MEKLSKLHLKIGVFLEPGLPWGPFYDWLRAKKNPRDRWRGLFKFYCLIKLEIA